MATKKSSTKKQTKPTDKNIPASLHPWNKYLALLYAMQGVVILILSVVKVFPVSTSFIGRDTLQTQAQGHVVLAAGMQHLFDINMVYLVAAFLFMAAIAHGLATTFLRSLYEQDLRQGINKIRWVEYSLSAGIMTLAISLLVGVQDLSTLLLLFGIVVVASLFGLVVETHKLEQRWLRYSITAVAGLAPWIVIVIYLISNAVYGSSSPSYVYWMVGTVFILFAGFVANACLVNSKVGKWADYLYGERIFMILSFVVKTALAWQIFAGVLHP